MDASEVIRRMQAKAIFSVRKEELQATQGAGPCLLSTCCGISTCVITFPSYENRYLFYLGQESCNPGNCPTGTQFISTVNCVNSNSYI